MTRWQVLPGTTALWGTSPGAASVMTIMAESYGADVRLVALMQYRPYRDRGGRRGLRGADLRRQSRPSRRPRWCGSRRSTGLALGETLALAVLGPVLARGSTFRPALSWCR